MSLHYEQRIINTLRKEQCLDDEHIAYFPEKFPEFTLDEFRDFTNSIFDNEGGGWDKVDQFQEKDAYFETYNIPFTRDNEKFYLTVMYGQGSAWMLMTESHFQETQKRLIENNYYREVAEDEEDEDPFQHEIGGEG